ncbi:MAG: hypothetical protein ACJ77G_04495 [Solirubrobacteraceae bacterium]
MIDLDEHMQVHHLHHEVAAECREPPRVALPARRIGRHALVGDRLGDREEAREDLELALGEGVDLLPLTGLRARPGPEPAAGLQAVEGVDERAPGAALEGGARERVVDPMRDEQAAHAQAPERLQAAVDLGGRCRIAAGSLHVCDRTGSMRQIGSSSTVWATISRSPASHARCSQT